MLDLTRVIEGPTCSQVLACLGADVLRVDPPGRPELLDQYLSNGMGKRSVALDHATGYLMAAHVLRLLADARSGVVRISAPRLSLPTDGPACAARSGRP